MTVKATHVDTIETEPEMQPETVLKEMRRLAASPVEVIQKWIFLAVLLLFGVFVWFAWQANAEQPEKLYTLLERQIIQTSESLKVQENALKELQQLAVRVPLEHQSAEVKLTLLDSGMTRMAANVEKLATDSCDLREAVKANTDAISKLIQVLEKPSQESVQ